MTVADVLAQEQARRDADDERHDREVTAIRDAVAAEFVVGGVTELAVLATDVHRVVLDALELRLCRPDMRRLIGDVVIGMGAVLIHVGNRPLYAAVRRRDVELPEALRQSTELRARFRTRRKASAAGTPGTAGTKTEISILKIEWDTRLAHEGLAPVSLIPRPRRAARAGKKFESDYSTDGDFATGDLTTAGGAGVQRQRRTSMAQIYQAANDNDLDLLAEVEEDRQVLKLRAQGLSLRKIAIAMGIDKMQVDRVLKRIERRRKDNSA